MFNDGCARAVKWCGGRIERNDDDNEVVMSIYMDNGEGTASIVTAFFLFTSGTRSGPGDLPFICPLKSLKFGQLPGACHKHCIRVPGGKFS